MAGSKSAADIHDCLAHRLGITPPYNRVCDWRNHAIDPLRASDRQKLVTDQLAEVDVGVCVLTSFSNASIYLSSPPRGDR